MDTETVETDLEVSDVSPVSPSGEASEKGEMMATTLSTRGPRIEISAFGYFGNVERFANPGFLGAG